MRILRSAFQQYTVTDIKSDVKETLYGLMVNDNYDPDDVIVDLISFSYDIKILRNHLKDCEMYENTQYIIKEVPIYRKLLAVLTPSVHLPDIDDIYAFYRGNKVCLLVQHPKQKPNAIKKSGLLNVDEHYTEGAING